MLHIVIVQFTVTTKLFWPIRYYVLFLNILDGAIMYRDICVHKDSGLLSSLQYSTQMLKCIITYVQKQGDAHVIYYCIHLRGRHEETAEVN